MPTNLAKSEDNQEAVGEPRVIKNGLAILGYGLVILIAVVLVSYLLKVSPSGNSGKGAREIFLVLENEAYRPKVISVGLNDKVTLNIKNNDKVSHGLHLPEFGVVESIPPLSRKRVSFIPAKKGMTAGSCANDAHNENLTVNVL